MGSPTINGAGPEDNKQDAAQMASGLFSDPQELQEQARALFTEEMATNSFQKFMNIVGEGELDLNQNGFNEMLMMIAIPLAAMNPKALEESIDFASKRMNDDQLFQMAGAIPEPMQSRLRALEQQGGAFSTSLGESNQEINERKHKERRTADFIQAASLATQREVIINQAVKDFSKDFENNALLYQNGAISYNQLQERTRESSAEAFEEVTKQSREIGESNAQIESNLDKTFEHIEKAIREKNPGLDEPQLQELIDTAKSELIEAKRNAGLTSQKIVTNDQDLRNATNRLYKPLSSLITGEEIMCTPADADSLKVKTNDLQMFLSDSYTAENFDIMDKSNLMALVKGQMDLLRDNAQTAKVESQQSIQEAENYLETYGDYLDENTTQEMQDVIQEARTQIEIADLQLEVSAISQEMIAKLEDTLPDNMEDLSAQQIKQIIIGAPTELFTKTEQIKQKMGELSTFNADEMTLNDPLSFIQENMEKFLERLPPEDREEIQNYFANVMEAKQQHAQAQEKLNVAVQTEYAVNADGLMMQNSILPGVPQVNAAISNRIMTEIAYNEVREAEAKLQQIAEDAGVKAPEAESDEGIVKTVEYTQDELYSDWDPEIEQMALTLIENGTTSPQDMEAILSANHFIGLDSGEEYSRNKLASMVADMQQSGTQDAPQIATATTANSATKVTTSAAQQYDDPDDSTPMTGAPNLGNAFSSASGQAYTPLLTQDQTYDFGNQNQQQQLNGGAGKFM